jgi:hypothetical protein
MVAVDVLLRASEWRAEQEQCAHQAPNQQAWTSLQQQDCTLGNDSWDSATPDTASVTSSPSRDGARTLGGLLDSLAELATHELMSLRAASDDNDGGGGSGDYRYTAHADDEGDCSASPVASPPSPPQQQQARQLRRPRSQSNPEGMERSAAAGWRLNSLGWRNPDTQVRQRLSPTATLDSIPVVQAHPIALCNRRCTRAPRQALVGAMPCAVAPSARNPTTLHCTATDMSAAAAAHRRSAVHPGGGAAGRRRRR